MTMDQLINPNEQARMATLNVVGFRRFSTDRRIAQHAAEIWKATPCPAVP